MQIDQARSLISGEKCLSPIEIITFHVGQNPEGFVQSFLRQIPILRTLEILSKK